MDEEDSRGEIDRTMWEVWEVWEVINRERNKRKRLNEDIKMEE